MSKDKVKELREKIRALEIANENLVIRANRLSDRVSRLTEESGKWKVAYSRLFYKLMHMGIEVE